MSDIISTPKRVEAEGFTTPANTQIAASIEVLFDVLPLDDRHRLLDMLDRKTRIIPGSRSGDVLGTIAKILAKRDQWTAQEIRDEVAACGIDATPKSVFNAVEYLVKKRRLEKLGGGRYQLSRALGYGNVREDGTIVTSAVDLGPGTVRNSEHYD